MRLPTFNTYLDQIKRLANAEHLTVVVGSGASIAAGLPGWEHLVKKLIERNAANREVAEHLVRTQGYLLASEVALPRQANPSRRKQLLREVLYDSRGPGKHLPAPLHQAIVKLAQRRDAGSLTILTTNYDNLLEVAFSDEDLPCRPRVEPTYPSSTPDSFTIHHMHGYLVPDEEGDDESQDVVISQSDYERIWQPSNDWSSEAFGEAAAKGPVLFLGTSLTDPNLLRMVQKVQTRGQHGDVLVLPRQGLNVRHELQESFLKRLGEQWRRYHVTPVLLQDFSDVSLFLQEVAAGISDSSMGPQDRALHLWSAVERDFEELQQKLSTTLHCDWGGKLKEALGEESTLTLWLSDGRKSLVRCADSNQIYLRPAALLRIDDHHDAGWVVSEAIANETGVVSQLP